MADIKDYLTFKNVIFLILVLLILKGLSFITVIALLFFASYVIASSLNPLVDKLERFMHRSLAAALVLAVVLTILFAFFLPVIFIAMKQVKGLLDILPEKIDLIQNFIFHYQFYGHKIPELLNVNSIMNSSTQITTGILNQSITITLNFAQGILFFLAICMIVFYFMADKKIIKDGLIRFFPEKMKEKASQIFDTISENVGGYVIAQLLSMVVIGLLTWFGMFILKVDYSLLLGLITGGLDIIPLIGPTIALILCLIMAYQLGWVKLLLVFLIFLTAQWIANNLFRPIIFGRFLNLHPLIIIFALFIAAQFLGVWGVILAPAIASMICVLLDELYLKPINKK